MDFTTARGSSSQSMCTLYGRRVKTLRQTPDPLQTTDCFWKWRTVDANYVGVMS